MKTIETKLRDSLNKEDIEVLHLSIIGSISGNDIIDNTIPSFFNDDAFNDTYIVLYTGDSSGVRSRITDYVKSTNTITIADTLTISAGDVYGIVSDSSKWLQDNIGDFLSKTYLQTLKETIGMEDLPNATLRNAIAKDTIYADSYSGITGTDYPNGTPEFPVNNLADAYSIAVARGVYIIRANGDFILTGDTTSYDNILIIGNGIFNTYITGDLTTGTDFSNSEIHGASVQGVCEGNLILRDCLVNGSFTNLSIYNCEVVDLYTDSYVYGFGVYGVDNTNFNSIEADRYITIVNLTGRFYINSLDEDSYVSMNGAVLDLTLPVVVGGATLIIEGNGEIIETSVDVSWTIDNHTLQGRNKGQDAIYDKITSVGTCERLLFMTSHRAVIEVGDSNEYVLSVIDKANGAIPMADITLGTFDVLKVDGTTHTGISTGNPLTKPENGSIVARYTHTSTDFDEGDGCRIIFRDIEVEIDGNTYILEPIEFQTRLSREKVIQDNVDTIITDVGIIDGNVDTLIDRGLSKTDGTTTYVALTGGEQDIINYTPASIEKINCIKMEMDNLTQNGEWKIYIEGEEQDSNTWATTDADGLYIHLNLILVENIKVSWTPAVAEAGDRVIPYSVRVEK